MQGPISEETLTREIELINHLYATRWFDMTNEEKMTCRIAQIRYSEELEKIRKKRKEEEKLRDQFEWCMI